MTDRLFLLDMDGVVCDFISGLIKSHGWGIKHDDFTSWNHHRSLGVTDEQMWSPTNDGKWWKNLDEYPWAQRLVVELRKIGDVIFCTSPSLDATCPSQKIIWLREHGLMDRSRNDYQIGPKKELMAKSGGILIDDSESNVLKYAKAGGKAILFPQPWNSNRHVSGEKVDWVIKNAMELFAS